MKGLPDLKEMYKKLHAHLSQLREGGRRKNLLLCLKTLAQCYGLYVLGVVIGGFCYGVWVGLHITGWM